MLRSLRMITFALFIFTAPPSSAAPNNSINDGKIIECQLLGGTVIPQPPGSGINACCYDNGEVQGCWICDENGNDCVFDKASRLPGVGTSPAYIGLFLNPPGVVQWQPVLPAPLVLQFAPR